MGQRSDDTNPEVDWAATLASLRTNFVEGSWERMHSLDEGLRLLQAAPADDAALQILRIAFHGFAGSGATYGLPRVSTLALEAEHACVDAMARGGAVSAELLTTVRRAVDALRAELAAAAVVAPGTPAAASGPQRLAALIVDDDPGLAAVLMTALRDEGLAPAVAGTLAEARAALRGTLPAAVVIDILLPDGSGFDLVREVRARTGGARVAIHAISARSEFLDKVEAVHCGADAFVAKPVDPRAVARRVALEARLRVQPPGRVLIVEDDAHQASFLRSLLSAAGYDVTICADGRLLETTLAEAPPDVVLMDVRLPGVDGFDLVRYLRQDERYRLLPVLFVTAADHPEQELAAERAGGDDVIAKPVAPAVLLTKVATRIERYRLLQSLLEHDGLTQLLTHSALLDRTRQALASARRDPERHFAWVMLDLDHFKAVNDRHGHATGDRVLAALAGLLRRRVRPADVIGRYGGEEFALVLEDLDRTDAVRLVERLRAEFADLEHVAPDGSRFRCTFSAGVAMATPGMNGPEDWYGAADAALYAAKRGGRNAVRAAGDPAAGPA
ncbi:MAG: diguanylate cyclase [Vicinamibacteria bacterium]|nr:diguanylate cyclase [Vicinamibacteria bacterium]